MLSVYTDKHIFVISVYTDVTDVLGTGMLLFYLFKVRRLSNELDRRKFMYTDTSRPP